MNTNDKFREDDPLHLEHLAKAMGEAGVRTGFGQDPVPRKTDALRQIAAKIRREWATSTRGMFTDEDVELLRTSVRNLQEAALPLMGLEEISDEVREDAQLKLLFADAAQRVSDVIERRIKSAQGTR